MFKAYLNQEGIEKQAYDLLKKTNAIRDAVTDEIIDSLEWSTLQGEKNKLKNLETDHLENIMITQELPYHYRVAILKILKERYSAK